MAFASRSALGFVATGLVAGAIYAAVDWSLDAMLGAGTLTGSLQLAHSILMIALPLVAGAALGLVMYSRRERAQAAHGALHRAELLHRKLERVERDQAAWVMAAAVLHEVNNPLHALGLLLDEAVEVEASASPELLARARGHVDRIARHVQTLRQLPRGGAPERTSLDVPVLVQRVIDERRFRFERAGVQIGLRVVAAATGHGDPSHVRVIVENLLDNAMHAAERGEKPAMVDVEIDATDTFVRVRVKDSGAGVDGEPHAVFEVFRSTRDGGLGLGLPIARTLARAMDGELELERDAECTCFALRLPREVAA